MRLRHLLVATATALLAAGAGLLPATAAHATGCWGSSCLNKDPEAMGCTDGQTIASASDPGGTIVAQVRYSPSCSAYWARGVIFPPSEPDNNEAWVHGWTCNAGCVSHVYPSGVFDSYTVYTNMIPIGYWVYACVNAYIGGTQLCTGTVGSGSGPR